LKKICHLSSVHARGDDRIFTKECVSLANAGYDVSFIVADDKNDEVVNGVKIYGVKKINSTLKRIITIPNMLFIKAKQIDADIYHLHDPELLPIGIKLKKLKKTVIFDSHEDVFKQLMSKTYLHPIMRYIVSLIYKFYEKKVVSKLDIVISTTPDIYAKFRKWHSQVYLIRNFPILGEFAVNNKDVTKGNNVLYLGGISKVRGIFEMVQAIDLCKTNVRLKLAGQFFPQSLKDEISKCKGWEKVDVLGFLDRKQISVLFQDIKVGLVTLLPTPNHISALAVKMFEYMSAGIPVIASNFPMWKRIVDESKCGISVNPMEPQEIADAIDFLIYNPETAKEMGNNGSNAVKEKYNWALEEKTLLQAYQQIKIW